MYLKIKYVIFKSKNIYLYFNYRKSMKKNDLLFGLIKSMSKSEKRHFKLYASRHTIGEQNNYVKLFDTIGSMQVYDETKVREALSGERFIRYLPSEKKYLYNIILNGLNAY